MAALAPAAVLEVATGTGAVTRAALPLLFGGSRYVATDLNQPMLDRARARAVQPADDRLEWSQADALALPFADASFDAVLCQFGVMFFPDRVRGYAEARRVLRPGGAYLFSTWDRIEENEFADEVTRAVGLMFPGDPPRFLARTPHGYHDSDQLRADLRAAGFASFEIETVTETSRAEGPRPPALAYTQGTPLRNEIEARDATRLDEATDRAEAALAARFGAGRVEGKIQALVVTAYA
jgi:ubiquinone/menaquinone biosynthesis C-methylase UbiE